MFLVAAGMMTKQTAGIHHITAIVGQPQENVDFYAGVLGLRLVKQTVNFDDPTTYHLYFGDEAARPGTIMTFFPWPNAYRGEIGDGQVGVTTFVVPANALSFWKDRLTSFDVQYTEATRFGEQYVQFCDRHGLQLELVAREGGELNTWSFSGVTPDVAIKGFGGAVLYSLDPEETNDVLVNVMGLRYVGEEDDYMRFASTGDIGNVIDVRMTTEARGTMGVGTVHHIAWRASDDADHAEWRTHVQQHGKAVTPVKDRNYFNAIYFREAGGILFEIATDTPGFAHDESFETMGTSLMLPAQYEEKRAELEQTLLPITVRPLR